MADEQISQIVISRKEARRDGRIRYFTGKPCKSGHISERLVSCGKCLACNRETQRSIRKDPNHLQKRREYSKTPEYKARRRNRWKLNGREPEYQRIIQRDPEFCRRRNERLRDKYRNDQNYRKRRRNTQRRYSSQRRALKRNSEGSYSYEDIEFLMMFQKKKCCYCKTSISSEYHVDHIVPLSKGGRSDLRNIQLLCPRCNLRKTNKDPIDWANEIGLLV